MFYLFKTYLNLKKSVLYKNIMSLFNINVQLKNVINN